jgi:hypothetical protein
LAGPSLSRVIPPDNAAGRYLDLGMQQRITDIVA